ncbi:MAG: response regulator [Acidobacteriota bacterium]
MKKSVILADNSYTIRRIVELSFSDEEEIDLISFENGLNISDKILELKPAVVLADIKLPDTNGYEICRFINKTEELKETKVFLIKGGFEPVDEEQLKDLKFEDFITKPFDSKALVITIKSFLEGSATPESEPVTEKAPSSIPEDLPELESLGEEGSDIDFADIKQEMDADDIMGDTLQSGESSIREDVLPSEEITQGAGSEEMEDKLSPETTDDLDNPFEGDNSIIPDEGSLTEEEIKIKENIKIQEQELQIGSLTQEEINIKMDIEKQKLQEDEDPLLDIKKEVEVPETTIPEPPIPEPTIPEPTIPEPTIPEAPEAVDTKPDIPEQEEVKDEPLLDSIKTSDLENVFSMDEVDKKPADDDKPEIDISTEPVKENIPESVITEDIEDKISNKIQEKFEPVVQEPASPETPPEAESKPEEDIKKGLDSKISILEGLKDKDKIVEKVEDKLSLSIKEILWEITPPIAEKIIKGEIEKIKEEIEKEYSK